MIVRQILQLKGSNAVETIEQSETVVAAAAVLFKKRIGALLVSDGESGIKGILSERDIVRALGEDGAECLGRTVGSMMTVKVECAAPDEEAVPVLERMTVGRFRHMPVLEDGALIGVISIGDVVKARISEMEMEQAALKGWITSG